MDGCVKCKERQEFHNALHAGLKQAGVDVKGIRFGNIKDQNGVTTRYEPLPEHDSYCRKKDNPEYYRAPAYLLEVDSGPQPAIMILAEPSAPNLDSSSKYVEYILSSIKKINEQ